MKSESTTMWNDGTRMLTVLLALILALMLGFAARAYAAPGDPDSGLDGDGQVTTDFGSGDFAEDVAVQEDGKIVVVGGAYVSNNLDFALARYNPNGTLDAAFGSGGKVTTPIGSSDDRAQAVAIQPDGKIVVAGGAGNGTNGDFALARYNPNGTLDPSFDGDGKVRTDFGSGADESASDVALEPDGKIVVAGAQSRTDSTTFELSVDFALARYNPDGTLDSNTDASPTTSFNGSGRLVHDFSGANDAANGLAIQPDGKIVAAGYAARLGHPADFAVARFNPGGSLDVGFNGSGKATLDFFLRDFFDAANDVVVQEDGKILLAGVATEYGSEAALVRYNPNGTLNTSFGYRGRASTNHYDNQAAQSVAVRDDGSIVLAGSHGDGTPGCSSCDYYSDFLVVRFSPSGIFNHFGQMDLGSVDDTASAIALQEDGKTVTAGTTNTSAAGRHNGFDFALVRQHWGADSTPPVVRPPAQGLLTNSTLGSAAATVRLSWSATDSEGEIARYELQQSTNGGPYAGVPLSQETATSISRQLALGNNYRFRVRATDDNGNRSAWKYGSRFAVDVHQESSTAVAFTGTWKPQSVSSASGEAVAYSTASGTTAKLTFTGRSVAWVAPKSRTRGKAEVYLDGRKVATVDLFSATAQVRRVVYAANALNPSVAHTLQIKALGTAGRPRVDVDAFVVLR